jgi:hypothetical protein
MKSQEIFMVHLYKQSEDMYDSTSNVLQKYKDEIVDKYRGVPAAGRTFTDSDEENYWCIVS